MPATKEVVVCRNDDETIEAVLGVVDERFVAEGLDPSKPTAMHTNSPLFRASSRSRGDEMLTESSTRLSSSALEQVSRRFHERQLVDPESIAALIHDSAEMILLSNHLQPLRGRQEIVTSLEEKDREHELYSGTVETFEWLDETTVLVCGQARYVTDAGGCAVSRVWWVDQFRDNLLWRVHAFTNESEARAWGAACLVESRVGAANGAPTPEGCGAGGPASRTYSPRVGLRCVQGVAGSRRYGVAHQVHGLHVLQGDAIGSGGWPHDFDSPLESEQKLAYGDTEWIVDHVDEEADPPAVWFRPVSEGDLAHLRAPNRKAVPSDQVPGVVGVRLPVKLVSPSRQSRLGSRRGRIA